MYLGINLPWEFLREGVPLFQMVCRKPTENPLNKLLEKQHLSKLNGKLHVTCYKHVKQCFSSLFFLDSAPHPSQSNQKKITMKREKKEDFHWKSKNKMWVSQK